MAAARARRARTSEIERVPARAADSSWDSAFLAAIHAQPDDDAPRIVYADALTERGDPRGELIQLQCEIARADEDDERWHRMKHRERALLKAHGERWTGELRALGKHLSFELRRGFVEVARGTSEELARVGAKLLAMAPLLTRFDVLCYERSLDDFVASEVFARAHVLHLGSGRRRIDLSPLASRSTSAPLRRLALDEVGLVRSDLEAVAASPALVGLRELEIHRCVLGKDSPAPLEGLEAALERFALVSGKHPEALVRALASGKAFERLKALALCNNPIGDDGAFALAHAGRLGSLEELDLRSNALTANAVSTLLARHVPARGLRRLLLGGNDLNDDIAEQVAAWTGAQDLVKLDLGSAAITDRGVVALAESPNLANLRSLVLSNCKARAATEKRLLASPHLARARLYVGERFLKRA